MSNIQRILLVIYLPITALILLLDNLYPKGDLVIYLKYTTIITLFLSTVVIKKKYYEQKIMSLALFFVVVADFFFVFSQSLHSLKMNLDPFGILGFMLAYICLSVTYHKKAKIGKKEVVSAIPIILIFLYAFFSLQAYVDLPMKIGTLIFGIVLCYMEWSAICTMFRGYYNGKVSCLIALSGSLMYLSDIVVSVAMFHPDYSNTFVPWLENIIWVTYVPAWTIIAMIVGEEKEIIVENP